MRSIKKALTVLLCTSLIANNTSYIMALDFTESNAESENTQILRLDGEIQNIKWTTPDSINLGEKFDAMSGVKALDKDGKDITDKIKVNGNVDTSKPGEYKIEYFIQGEEDKKISRTIKVLDKNNQDESSTETVLKTEITGPQIVSVYQGDNFDIKSNIKSTDEKGKDITSNVQVEGTVDTNKLGEYKLKYLVNSDSGQKAILERTVKVIEKNVFNFYINKDDKNVHEKPNPETKVTESGKKVGFSLYLDLNTSKFVVNNQSQEMLDKTKPKEVYANISVFDKDNKEKLALELLGEDTGNSTKFDKLKELGYEYGDFIQISLSNPKDNFDISGKLSGDVITEKVDENTIIQEDYKDGVDDLDYINNVRFEISEDGIKSVYNKAPEITGLSDMTELLTDRNKQLEGVVVNDDKDGVIPNDEIEITEESNDEGKVIGLRYTVSDSWGRSVSSVRKLVENTDKSTYTTSNPNQGTNTSLKDNVITVKGFTYADGNDVRFKINFNTDEMKFNISDRDGRLFDNKVSGKYFEMTLYDKNSQLKRKLTLNGDDKANSDKIDEFVKEPFEIGDQIHLYHRYSSEKLSIAGTIKDLNSSRNNLSTGVPADVIEKNRFKLERDGLVYLRNQAPTIDGTNETLNVVIGQKPDFFKGVTVNDDIDGLIQNSKVEVTGFNPNQLGTQTITYTVSDSWGETTTATRTVIVTSETKLSNTSIDVYNNNGTNKVFSIKFDDINKRIKIENKINTQLESTNATDTAFRIKILSKAGITKKTLELNGNENGNSTKLNELHNYNYSVGDYVELWRKPTIEATAEEIAPATGETTEGTLPTTKTAVKGIKIVGDLEKKDELKDVTYENGINDIDHMINVRFMLDKDVLYAKYNKAPTLEFVSDLTIKRGEEFNPINFVSQVKDDNDKLDKKLVRASYNKDEIQNVGDHTVTYTVKDKWGRSSEETKQTITVLPKNNLEKNKIVLKKQLDNGTNKDIVTLHFDDVKNKIVKEVKNGESISGIVGTDVFSIEIFDGSGSQVAKSTLGANISLNNNSFSEITNITLQDNYSISVSAYDKDKLCIKGYVGSAKETQSENQNKQEFIFKNDDEMNNTRFALKDNGLFKVYNKAPEFIGLDDISIIKGSTFEKLTGVSVVDDHDGNINISNENITGDINTSNVGLQQIIYTVSDSWGRSTMVTRNVLVKPIAVNNSIEVKDSQNELAFKIGFDFERNRLVIENIKEGSLNSSNNTEVYIAIYDDKDRLINSVELLGNDTNISQKLNKLTNNYIGVNSSIRVWSKDPNKVAVKGTLINPEQETYSEVVNNQEEINNVKFKIVEDGLKVIYNNAPEIRLPREYPILYKGDDYREGLLNGVKIKDDHDDIDTSKVKFKVRKLEQPQVSKNQSEEVTETPSNSEDEFNVVDSLGKYEAEYEITDNWGRTYKEKREFRVENSMRRHEIIFGGYKDGSDVTPLVIEFNPDTMRFKIKSRTGDKFNNAPYMDDTVIHSFYVYDGDTNNQKYGISMFARDRGDDPKFNRINELQVEYGDYIKFYNGRNNGQTFRLKIQGPVRDTDYDYSKGATNGDEFINSNFYIKEEGLTAKYIPPIEVAKDETIFEYVGAEGMVPLRILFNYNTNTMRISGNRSAGYEYAPEGSPDLGQQQLKITWRKKDGTKKAEVSLHISRDFGPQPVIDAFRQANSGNGNNGIFNFEDGDYFTFESKQSNKIRIYNNFENTTNDPNLSDGISSDDIVQNTRFILGADKESNPSSKTTTSNKTMKVLYNDAPVIKGIDDVNIYVGDTFNIKDGVTVSDKIDNDNGISIDYRVSTSNGQDLDGDYYEVTGKEVGKHVLTYTATDSWGRTGTYTRTVYVRPEVFKNKISLYPKEKASESSTEQEQSKPLFEIGFDNDTGRYTVSNQSEDYINQDLGTDTAFNISIYSNNGELKQTVELRGIDRGTDEKIEQLKQVDYAYDDCIRVWSADPKQLRIEGPITGDVKTPTANEVSPLNGESKDTNIEQTKKEENYSDGIDDKDYMENVAFQATKSGVKTIYNNAPVINTENINKEILFGSDDINLKDGITVSDDKTNNLEVSQIEVSGEDVNFNKIGRYTVTYSISDSWGRVGTANVTYNVVSNVKNNIIEIYDSSEKFFDIKFNIEDNTFDVKQVETPNTINSVSTESTESTNPYFEFILRSEDTSEKKKITASSKSELDSKINELESIKFSDGDTIELYSSSKSNVKIKGNINDTENGEDFDQSFPNSLDFKQTRFIIGNNGLDVLRYEAPTITFTNGNNLNVTRGDIEAPEKDVVIEFTNPVNKNGLVLETIEGFNSTTIGTQNIKYKFIDSWGHKHEKDRTITVVERNKLEENKIELLNSENGANIVTFEFDTIENKIKPVVKINRPTKSNEDLMTITLYDDTGITKDSIKVTSENFNNLQPIDFVEGDLVGITSYDIRNGLSIKGTIHDQKEPYSDGVNDKDNIDNVRFKLDEKGLKSIYNNAPTLTINGDLQTFKDESVDFYEDVTVSDSDPHDKDVINVQDNIQVSSNLDISKMSNYTATYTLSDTWGRSVSKERQIIVKSSLGNNKIQYFPPNSKDAAFSISMNTATKHLEVEKIHEDLKDTPITRFINRITRSIDSNNPGEGTDNQGTEPETSGTNKIFEVILFTEDMEVRKKLTIESTDNTESVKLKLDTFNNDTTYKHGDFIGVYAKDNANGIKILGNIDIPYEINEKYDDGIQNDDFMNNVRFNIKEDAMYAVYNQAPTMKVPDDIVDIYKGDEIRVYDNVKVSDDLDKNISNINITISDYDRERLQNVDLTTEKEKQVIVDINLSDSWGRSVSSQRTFKVKNALERNVMTFNAYNNGTTDAFEISFDLENKRLKTEQILRSGLVNNNADGTIYSISVYNKDGELKDNGQFEFDAKHTFNNDGQATMTLNSINNVSFEYGDYIKFSGVQLFRVGINGAVRDEIEDYSNKINQATDGKNTKFIIEDSGIRAELEQVDNLTEGQNIIEFIGSDGKKPLRMKIDNNTRRIEVFAAGTNDVDGHYDYNGGQFGQNKDILTITLHRASRQNLTATARHGNSAWSNPFRDVFNNQTFTEGDYIEIKSLKPEGVRILGNIEYDKEEYPEVDFSMGFGTEKNLDKSNIYLAKPKANDNNKKTIEITADPTPIVINAEDKRVQQGDTDFSITDGVNVDYGNGQQVPIPESAVENGVAKLSNGDTVTIEGDVDVHQIGLYAVKYTVTNSYGVTTSKTRNINIYAPAGLGLKKSDATPTIEKGSILPKEEAIKERLKEFVVATDTDGTDISDKIEVNLKNFNQEEEGRHTVTYSVKSGFEDIITKEVDVNVVRSISVSVPTKIPFQVVTNLMENNSNDEFISGVLKLTNNRTSNVEVYLKDFNAQDGNTLEIVNHDYTDDWDNLPIEESMTKMALGIYPSRNINGEDINQSEPIWLNSKKGESTKRNSETKLGTIPRATLTEKTPEESETPTRQGESSTEGSDTSSKVTITPTEGKISFTSKHGKNFKGGTARGKFNLVFSFK